MKKVSGPDLVDAGKEQVRDARDVLVLFGLGPRWIGRRDVVRRWQPLLERAGNIDVRKVEPLIRWGHLHPSALRTRHRDQILRPHEGLERIELVAGRLDGWQARFVRVHAGDTRGNGYPRRKPRTGLASAPPGSDPCLGALAPRASRVARQCLRSCEASRKTARARARRRRSPVFPPP